MNFILLDKICFTVTVSTIMNFILEGQILFHWFSSENVHCQQLWISFWKANSVSPNQAAKRHIIITLLLLTHSESSCSWCWYWCCWQRYSNNSYIFNQSDIKIIFITLTIKFKWYLHSLWPPSAPSTLSVFTQTWKGLVLVQTVPWESSVVKLSMYPAGWSIKFLTQLQKKCKLLD